MKRAEILEFVRAALARAAPDQSLGEDDLNRSLTGDLGLDSIRLAALFDELRAVSDIDMTPWFVDHANAGTDTVSTLVDFLLENEFGAAGTARTPGDA